MNIRSLASQAALVPGQLRLLVLFWGRSSGGKRAEEWRCGRQASFSGNRAVFYPRMCNRNQIADASEVPVTTESY